MHASNLQVDRLLSLVIRHAAVIQAAVSSQAFEVDTAGFILAYLQVKVLIVEATDSLGEMELLLHKGTHQRQPSPTWKQLSMHRNMHNTCCSEVNMKAE
jgi:hypothetical protein